MLICIKNLDKLQKRAIRIIQGLGYREHTGEHFKSLSILKFSDMVTLETTTLAYKGYIGILPDNLQKKYKKNEESSYNFRRIKN